MAEHDKALSLADVKASFLKAEETLRGISASMRDVEAASSQLSGARTSVTTAGERLVGLADRLESLAQAMREATEVLQKTDPAVIARKLSDIDSRTSEANTVAKSTAAGVTVAKTLLEQVGGQAGSIHADLRVLASETGALRREIASGNELIVQIGGEVEGVRSELRALTSEMGSLRRTSDAAGKNLKAIEGEVTEAKGIVSANRLLLVTIATLGLVAAVFATLRSYGVV